MKLWDLRQTALPFCVFVSLCCQMAKIMASSQVLLGESSEMLPVKGTLKTTERPK